MFLLASKAVVVALCFALAAYIIASISRVAFLFVSARKLKKLGKEFEVKVTDSAADVDVTIGTK